MDEFEYKDYKIVKDKSDPRYFVIKPQKGALPQSLSGIFTNVHMAQKLIDDYIARVMDKAHAKGAN